MSHTPVLLDEVIEGLDVKSDDRILDCTVGNGGHASFLIRRLGPKGYYIGIDADSDALKEAEKQLLEWERKSTLKDGTLILEVTEVYEPIKSFKFEKQKREVSK